MPQGDRDQKVVSRRKLLALSGGGLALVTLGVACQGSSTTAAPTSAAASSPASPPAAPSPVASASVLAQPSPSISSAVPSPSVVRYTNTVTINFGSVTPSVSQMAPYIADKHGFFDQYGVKLNQVVLQTSTSVVQALVGRTVDVAETSPPSLVVAYAKGDSDLALISGMVEKVAYVLMAAQDVSSYDQLKGKTIGISSFGDGLTVITRLLLQKHGLSDSDYSFVAIGSSPERYSALISGGVQAVVISQPYDFQLRRQGYNRLGDTTEVESQYSFIGLGAARSWVNGNRDAVTRFLAACVQGQEFFTNPANRSASLQDMQDYVSMSAEDAGATYDLLVTQLQAYPPNMEPSNAGIQAVIDISVQLGDIDPPGPSVSELLDLDALHAAQQLAGASG